MAHPIPWGCVGRSGGVVAMVASKKNCYRHYMEMWGRIECASARLEGGGD